MKPLTHCSLRALRDAVRSGEVSAREVAQAHLDRITEVEPAISALLAVTADDALAQADAVDAARSRGDKIGPLAGVPIALKDVICTRGVATTCGSRILAGWKPPYDATVAARIREAGAVMLGKANCDEFAMGSSTENSAYGPTRNPWNLACVPGGSSGGSAAAVAAREVAGSLGSDTGGSIRQPAALCGIVGLKPTYGRVSRFGLVAYASSLDQIGPMARSVEDAALLLEAICGLDPLDSTSVDAAPFTATAVTRGDIRGLRIGVPREFLGDGVDGPVVAAVRAAVEALCAMGATAEECSLRTVRHSLATYYILAPAEASSNLARYDGVRFGLRAEGGSGHAGMTEASREAGFGAETKQRILVGTYALSAGYYDAYYLRAQKVRTLIRRDFDAAFERFDVLVTPTSPTVAFGIGEKSDDPLAMKLADVCTLPANMAGIPGVSIPCGMDRGLPIGLQIMGRSFDEETTLRAAYAYEQATHWHTLRPEVNR
jgi:aspartyl-tRNA(Asn)/glutamyl-tRNA(Gln) amidotransferase subunit A